MVLVESLAVRRLYISSVSPIAVSIVLVLVLGLTPCVADTIHLKNGRNIVADQVRESGNRVEYDIGEGTYSILRSSVERIDKGGEMSSHSPPAESAPKPAVTLSGAEQVSSQVVHDGLIDFDALREAEKSGNPTRAAAANLSVAEFDSKRGKLEDARSYLEQALTFLPNEPLLLENLVEVLWKLGRIKEALYPSERAEQLAPGSADAQAILGYTYFQLNRTKDAIRCWRRSLELRSDPAISSLLDRALRENSAEADFHDQVSSHFLLKYEGKQSGEKLRADVLSTLEGHFNELVSILDYIPREPISVSLYTQKAFFDVTQAPSWSAAMNDGKLRIPIDGLDHVTPELSRVLKHELAHSFISQITHNRAPGWLHEGIAQTVEPKSLGGSARRLGQYYEAQRNIPLNSLEGSFEGFSADEAVLAYAESLASVQYLSATYGMGSVDRILKRLGEGEPTESALRSTIHSGYSQLERELTEYLKKQ